MINIVERIELKVLLFVFKSEFKKKKRIEKESYQVKFIQIHNY